MRKFFKAFIPIVGATLFAGVTAFVMNTLTSLDIIKPQEDYTKWVVVLSYAVAIIIGALMGFLLFPSIAKGFAALETKLKKMPIGDLIAAAIGLAFGLMLAFFLTKLIDLINFVWIKVSVSLVLYIMLGVGVMRIALNRRRDVTFSSVFRRRREQSQREGMGEPSGIKLLDTSVIIDGRIYDICKTGFLEGELVVPVFVLNELRTISDSGDDLKRTRGRRGLDVLSRLQNELNRPVTVKDVDYDDLSDVDSKLLRMAGELGAGVITNDFNLNKVAKVQNIQVFNINDLANAVKPVAVPGDSMAVLIIKQGKEPGQGVAYLDDGTMIVVESAGGRIGEKLDITVTSALQTSAGRMIFGKPAAV